MFHEVVMQKKRLKIIPDRIFHKLWDEAGKYDDLDEYIISTSSNSKVFNYKSHDLDYPEYAELLKNIYTCRKLKLKDIADKTSKQKSELSHIFCIPIRTIEAWYSDINTIPAYILLMMLKHFHLINLGKYIRLESEIEREATRPAIYNKRKPSDNPKSASEYEYPDPEERTEYEKYMESDDYAEYLDRLVEKIKRGRRSSDPK